MNLMISDIIRIQATDCHNNIQLVIMFNNGLNELQYVLCIMIMIMIMIKVLGKGRACIPGYYYFYTDHRLRMY